MKKSNNVPIKMNTCKLKYKQTNKRNQAIRVGQQSRLEGMYVNIVASRSVHINK